MPVLCRLERLKRWRLFCPCCGCQLGIASGEAPGGWAVAPAVCTAKRGGSIWRCPSQVCLSLCCCLHSSSAVPLQFRLHPSSNRWQGCLALGWAGGCPQPCAQLCQLGLCLHRCLIPLAEKVGWMSPARHWLLLPQGFHSPVAPFGTCLPYHQVHISVLWHRILPLTLQPCSPSLRGGAGYSALRCLPTPCHRCWYSWAKFSGIA